MSSADMYAKYTCIYMCQDDMNTCKCARASHHIEVHEQHRIFLFSRVRRCQLRNATPGLGVDLTSLSVCGEPEFALGFLIFIQECQLPLLSTLERVTSSEDPFNEKNEVPTQFFSALDNPGASLPFLKNRGMSRGNCIIWGAQYKMKM